MVRQCSQLRFARAQWHRCARMQEAEQGKFVQAQLCSVLSLSLSIYLSFSLSFWMLSRSPVARVARHKSMLRHTEEAHTHERATCSTSAALQCSLLSRDLMSGVPLINPAATH